MTSRESTSRSLPTRRGFLAGSAAVAGASVAAGASPAAASTDAASTDLPILAQRLRWPHGPGYPNHQQNPDAELRSILRQIDPDRIRQTIETLVGFGTRHTLSTQTDPNRGIGAAPTWIASPLQQYAAQSGGRMTVEVQSFVQPVSNRVPVPTEISNVIATLRGSWAPDRTYVVSG